VGERVAGGHAASACIQHDIEGDMRLTSTAFAHHASIPERYTCQGQNVSPPLRIEAVPAAAKSLALIVDDPDAPDPAAPKRIWVHWVVYDLPPDTRELDEGVSALPGDARTGTNDWGATMYGGPCPPIGRHRYFFKL
jgi:Raf kinase inhibitor-like YbhB/YbcL family protein